MTTGLTAGARGKDNNWFGLGLFITCLMLMVLISIFVKLTGDQVPINQILLFRFGISLIPLWTMAAFDYRRFTLRTRRVKDHSFRIFFGVISLATYFVAIKMIPLAAATSIAFAGPIFCVVLAIPILGEIIGIRRWSAVIIGFVGVLVISLPGADWASNETWMIGSLAAIASAIGGALVSIYLRKLSESEAALTITIYHNTAGALIFATWTLTAGWVPMSEQDWMLLLGLGLIAGFQQFALTNAYRFAEATFLAPFEYLLLVFAALAGYLIWSEVPTVNTWIGALIIAGSGLFMLHRKKVVELPAAS